MREIDLNADLGEESPHEAELFAVVSSANISCGAHAGGGEFLKAAISHAIAHDVAIGAHPSYPDRANFGRLSMLELLTHEELVESLVEQLREFVAVLTEAGGKLHHIKAHGALYNDALVHVSAAKALLEAVSRAEDELGLPGLPIVTMTGELARLASSQGRKVILEFFADRAYSIDGTLVPRTAPNAVFHDDQQITTRTLRFIKEGVIASVDGTDLNMSAETICVHGDNPQALAIARQLRQTLIESGISVRAV